jgi:hypothetical protein
MSRSDPYDDDDDDRPRRRRDRDDDDDRPVRRRRRGDDLEDDYRDGPRRRAPVGDGLGVAAMIIGIVSIVLTLGCCVPYVGFVSGPLSLIGAITAIILGFVGRSKVPGSGKALAGIITGFLSLALGLLMLLLVALGVGFMAMNQPPGGNNNNFGGPGGGGMQRNRF